MVGDNMAGDKHETNDVDERFRGLLEGLRTSLPGVQVLVAFLLILPMQSGFREIDGFARTAYLVAFTSALIASILLITPSVHQRVRAPFTGLERRSERHLESAVRTTIAGTIAMAVALVAAAALVISVVTDSQIATMAAVAAAVFTSWFWFLQPLLWARQEGGFDARD